MNSIHLHSAWFMKNYEFSFVLPASGNLFVLNITCSIFNTVIELFYLCSRQELNCPAVFCGSCKACKFSYVVKLKYF